MARPPAPSAARDLRLLAGAAFLSSAGDMLALVTLALAVHDLTHSGLAVSAYFATTMLPVVVAAPLAGWVADAFESVRVMAVASLVQAALAVALAFSTSQLAALLALSALLCAGSAIAQPAEFALVPRLAGAGGLTRATGVMEAARYAGYAAGPAVAGVIAAAGDARLAMLVDATSFLAIAAAAGLIRARRPPRAAPRGAVPERARDGVAVLWGDPVLRPALLAATVALLFISASMTVEVFYVTEVLGAGEVGYAVLTVAWMAGMVAGATAVAPRLPARVTATAALAALAVQGLGMAAQTAWAVLPAALAGYVVGGLGHGAKNTLLRALIARRVPERVHGRAFAAYGAARNGAELAALGAGGVLVAAIGPRTALLLAGLGPVLAALAGLAALHRPWRRVPALPTRPPLPEVS